MKKIALLLVAIIGAACSDNSEEISDPVIVEDPIIIEDPVPQITKLVEKMVLQPSNNPYGTSKDGDGLTFFYDGEKLEKSTEKAPTMSFTTYYEYDEDKIIGAETSLFGTLFRSEKFSYDNEGRLISREVKVFTTEEHLIGSYSYESGNIVKYDISEVISGIEGRDYSIFSEVYTVDDEMNILKITRAENEVEFLIDENHSPYSDITGYLDAYRFVKRLSRNNYISQTSTEFKTGNKQTWDISNTYDSNGYLLTETYEDASTSKHYFYVE